MSTRTTVNPPAPTSSTERPRSKRPGFKVLQPAATHTGAPIAPLKKGLPKNTQSLCPECGSVIDAQLFEEGGRVYMAKTCAQHGDFRDLYYSDAALYLKMEEWEFGDGRGVSNPAVERADASCPTDCGLCSLHHSHTGLANVDLTNRCNLTCPVCFANANAAGYLYEPSFEQVRGMLRALREERPLAGRVGQFSGGEPTVHPQFLEICAMAREMGFSHIQAATNGLMLADPDFARQAKDCGLTTLYLQFDGMDDAIYLRTRGQRLFATKLKVVENARAVGMKIVLVPTIVRGINDHQSRW